ncbi:MAG: glycoside hydrolase family 43 protein [bacterium]
MNRSQQAHQPNDSRCFRPGQVWLDTAGKPINAHGGGMLHHEGVYYWYGEQRPEGPSSLNAEIGISVYSSRDLLTWQFERTALPVNREDPASPLVPGCKMERPKVVYNARTRQFVMWWHHDLKGWGHHGAFAGVAVSDSPAGPFTLVKVFRPGYIMFRDCTVFQDDDGSAHLVFATDDNANLAMVRLTDDYLEPTSNILRQFCGRYMEAPCVFKYDGRYGFIGSDCTGWAPNEARSAVAPALAGPWRECGNPCLGEGAEIAYGTQSTFVLPVAGKPGAFILMADQWRPDNLADSRYVWLPMFFKTTVLNQPPRPFVRWVDKWDLTIFDQPPYAGGEQPVYQKEHE